MYARARACGSVSACVCACACACNFICAYVLVGMYVRVRAHVHVCAMWVCFCVCGHMFAFVRVGVICISLGILRQAVKVLNLRETIRFLPENSQPLMGTFHAYIMTRAHTPANTQAHMLKYADICK